MDPKRFKETHAHALAERKPFAHLTTQIKLLLHLLSLLLVSQINNRVDHVLYSKGIWLSLRRKKALNRSSLPSSQGETIASKPHQRRKMVVSWMELGLVDLL